MELCWHPYDYFPYEKVLALREVQALIAPLQVSETDIGLRLEGTVNFEITKRLVYFNHVKNEQTPLPTLQAELEKESNGGSRRQSTRYSVHGLHEYKGKFNPQIVRAILNILGISAKSRVLDPFCGSGTTLVECSHVGIESVGIDLNPLAVFLSNTKISTLKQTGDCLRRELKAILSASNRTHTTYGDERFQYLEKWFVEWNLLEIENLKSSIDLASHSCRPFFLTIASNLLREYSEQDPKDLRIRRRKSPLPDVPFHKAFEKHALLNIEKLERAKSVIGDRVGDGIALHGDIRDLKVNLGSFDCVITSPPYASALPYIDTQRLSLVWLGLIEPPEILPLEANLVGSREIRGISRHDLDGIFCLNERNIPEQQHAYCQELADSIGIGDGFRRRAVPTLLYRYFADMASSFQAVRRCVPKGAIYALVIGSNHTVLDGQRYDIDTPKHLVEIAEHCEWSLVEIITLQTYSRYGYNFNNSVTGEKLVLLAAS